MRIKITTNTNDALLQNVDRAMNDSKTISTESNTDYVFNKQVGDVR